MAKKKSTKEKDIDNLCSATPLSPKTEKALKRSYMLSPLTIRKIDELNFSLIVFNLWMLPLLQFK